MVLNEPRVNEYLVTRLLQEHNVNLKLCGNGTHFPLKELVRRIQYGEIELAQVEKEHQLEIRQTFVVVKVLRTLANLSFQELYETCTIFQDGSSLHRYSSDLTGIHNHADSLEETARKIVYRDLGQSQPRFLTLKLCRFNKKQEKKEVLITERSNLWYGIRLVVKKVHFEIVIPKELYKEEYKKTVKTTEGKVFKSSYFSWRMI